MFAVSLRLSRTARFISATRSGATAMTWSRTRRCARKARLPLVAALISMLDMPAQAQRIENVMANFAALDKVTAAVKQLQVELNKTAEFRTLRITPRVCYTRDPKEPPRTSTFVEVDEIMFDGKEKRIFTGWMFAESPGLNPLIHPVFDVWLTSCAQPQSAPAAKGPSADTATPPSADPSAQSRKKRPR
jgi:hypothetical protein